MGEYTYILKYFSAIPYFFSNGCHSEQFSVKGGTTAQLSCRFHAHPAGQVTWSKKMTANDATQDFQSIADSDGLQSVVIVSTHSSKSPSKTGKLNVSLSIIN